MKKRSGLQVMGRLIGLVKPLTGFMVLAVFMGLAGHLAAAFIPIFGGYAVLDVISADAQVFSITAIFWSVCIFALLRGVLRYAEQGCNHYIAFKLLALIRDRVFRALRKLCPAKLECKGKGDLISLITSDIELLEVFYAHTISPAAIAFLFTIFMCVFIGLQHWVLGILALLAYLTVGLLVPFLIAKLGGEDGMRFREKAGDLSSFVLDSMRGLNETLQYGTGEKRLAEMNEKTDALSKNDARMKKNVGRNMAITNGVIYFFDAAMLIAGLLLWKQGVASPAAVLISTIAMMSSFGPTIALANLGSTLQSTFAAGNRVLDILDEEPMVEEVTGQEELAFHGARAEIRSFAYEGEPVLRDVTLDVPENRVIGIVGRSGSGKSTLLKLLMRFWKVQDGSITVSGREIDRINTENLRNMESFVTQETHLFHDSIRSNLKIAKLDATEEEMVAACKKASVHDLIMSLPRGYDTQVGELGDTLSGGEKQRIGLARAFLHDAPFMLLDEPTSNLDSLNEAVILKSLHEQKNGKTVMLVSHRASTVRIADTVISVENGRLS